MLTISGTSGVPPTALPFLVGQVCFFAMEVAPSGFLVCNGAAVSRTTYAALFSAIGTIHGVGNGVTTFNLPDLRGEFIRGWDNSRGVDVGRVFGSWQDDQLKAHTHSYQWFPGEGNGETDNNYQAGHTQVTGTTGSTGGAETRPRNVALLPCVYAGTPITANFTAATLGWQPNATILESIQDVGTATVGSAYVELVFRSNGSIGGTANANAYLSALGANYGANFEISVDVATLVDGYRFTVFGTTVTASGYQSGWFSLGSDRTISAFSNDVGSGVLTTEASGTIRIRAAGQASTLISIPFHLRATSNAD